MSDIVTEQWIQIQQLEQALQITEVLLINNLIFLCPFHEKESTPCVNDLNEFDFVPDESIDGYKACKKHKVQFLEGSRKMSRFGSHFSLKFPVLIYLFTLPKIFITKLSVIFGFVVCQKPLWQSSWKVNREARSILVCIEFLHVPNLASFKTNFIGSKAFASPGMD